MVIYIFHSSNRTQFLNTSIFIIRFICKISCGRGNQF